VPLKTFHIAYFSKLMDHLLQGNASKNHPTERTGHPWHLPKVLVSMLNKHVRQLKYREG
jgi:hypothetical protein